MSTDRVNLTFDPVHGYIPFVSGAGLPAGEVSERQIIDNPWVQRMRQIHQLQTAWWVYPSAEHTRFPHIIGAMHLASRAAEALYPSLQQSCPDCPSRGYVETLLRMSGLLHDVGHGPFGHFFDEHFLKDYGLTHETLGAAIIRERLADSLRRVRRNPNSALEPGEALDPEQIAWLIQRPRPGDAADRPRWLVLLRSLLSGIYTIDNMDFVLRDALMTGYSPRAFDLDRLLHYSFFTAEGLTIHDRGADALVRFIGVRAELFRSVYFHRTVRAIDLALKDLFVASRRWLFPGNPLEKLDDYLYFTEMSLLMDVQRWPAAGDPEQRALGLRWRDLIARKLPWVTVCQRSLTFTRDDSEQASIFSDPALVEQKLRQLLPLELRDVPLRVDIPRTQVFRPNTLGPAEGLNFLFDSARERVRPLTTHDLFRRLPTAQRLCRIYAPTDERAPQIAAALDQMLGGALDDATNM
ncbi:MAG: HD domain-containing protein [Pirellulaceae bacterium]|nr:HD domain-containing protein [Pirellulaceae bacterium]